MRSSARLHLSRIKWLDTVRIAFLFTRSARGFSQLLSLFYCSIVLLFYCSIVLLFYCSIVPRAAKTCLVLLFGFIVFGYAVSGKNLFGISVAVGGLMYYSKIKLRQVDDAPAGSSASPKS